MNKTLLWTLAPFLAATSALSATPPAACQAAGVAGAWSLGNILNLGGRGREAEARRLSRSGRQSARPSRRPGGARPGIDGEVPPGHLGCDRQGQGTRCPGRAQLCRLPRSRSWLRPNRPGSRLSVYLAAYLPQDGQSLLGGRPRPIRTARPVQRCRSTRTTALRRSPPRRCAGLFANDAPAQVGAAIAAAIVPEPLGPLATPGAPEREIRPCGQGLHPHGPRPGGQPGPASRRWSQPRRVRLEQTLDTGHTPFVTNPGRRRAAAIEAAIRQ